MSLKNVLHKHQPWYDSFDQNSDSWGCECNKQTGYFTRGEVVEKHILPLVRAAALVEVTAKLKDIFANAGMDLDVILKSELVFREKPPTGKDCDVCNGTGTHWYNPDYPMGDCGQREPEPCPACDGKGWRV